MTIEEEFNADKTGADCTTCHLNTDFCMECIAMRKAAFLAGAAAQNKINKDYYEAVDNALIVGPQCVATGDAKADIHKLLSWEVAVALDPAVSGDARALIELGKLEQKQKDVEIAKAFAQDAKTYMASVTPRGYIPDKTEELTYRKIAAAIEKG